MRETQRHLSFQFWYYRRDRVHFMILTLSSILENLSLFTKLPFSIRKLSYFRIQIAPISSLTLVRSHDLWVFGFFICISKMVNYINPKLPSLLFL